ncbi:phosphinothricin N-acetyltransferase [mine drainage metagenome]|uniref:Phosphinothricin N-acetyltransferase n=1 Tax=mine drainage metagenome TaxID=410659 RepID=A0A1J5NWS0_9ZZZZ
MSDFLIRLATEADVAACATIYRHHVLHGTGTFETEPPDEQDMLRRLREVQGRDLPWLVAQREGSGMVGGFAYANWFRAREAYRFTVEDSIYIDPDAQRQGLGNDLLTALIDACVAAGARQMLAVIGDSANAGSMYDITLLRMAKRDEQLRLRTLQMRDLVQPAQTVVRQDAGLEAMSELFLHHPVKYLYVTDGLERFLGVVPLKKLSAAAGVSDLAQRCAADLLSDEITPLTSDMSLAEALQRFMEHRGERLPVIDSLASPVLLGAVNKSTLLATYVRLSE